MKAITIYEAIDGTRFDNESDCSLYEKLIKECDDLMSQLRQNNEVCSNVAIQQKVGLVKSLYLSFMQICAIYIPLHKDIFMQCGLGCRHPSHASRILSDYYRDLPILYKTSYRFDCISDKSGIEYEQPYYTSHEEEFKGDIK